jgi:hypothetical protein
MQKNEINLILNNTRWKAKRVNENKMHKKRGQKRDETKWNIKKSFELISKLFVLVFRVFCSL